MLFRMIFVLCLFFLSAVGWTEVRLKKTSPCAGVVFHGDETLNFNDNEKKFICGDEQILDWKELPTYQKKNHIEALLQTRGYYLSRMERKDEVLNIRLGAVKKVRGIHFHGFSPGKELTNNTTVIGQRLTPKALNEIEQLTRTYLKTIGHPCSIVRIEADPETEQVDVFVELDAETYFQSPDEKPYEELFDSVFPRHYVFTKGARYNQRLLSLTSQRILKEGIITFSRFATKCSEGDERQHTALRHDTVLGLPRIFRVGVGFNTEIGPFVSLRWTHARLSKAATQFQSQLQASFVEQSITLSGKAHPTESFPRSFLIPKLKVSHFDEKTFESIETKLSVRLGTQWENLHSSSRLSFGPSYTYTDILEGVGTSEGYLALHLEKSLWSHDFEFFSGSPRKGYEVNFKTAHAGPATGAGFTATRFELNGRWLHNVESYTPERVILGARFKVASTLKGETDSLSDLPLEFREFAGGSRDIRGFSRKALPLDGQGVLSLVYLGLELRTNSLVPYGLQPLLFWDFAGLSQESFELTSPYFHSPGLGLRWATPLGVFRFSYARGYEFGNQSSNSVNNQFHLSYGEEF